MSNAKPMNGRRAWRKWLKAERRKDKTSWAAGIGTCKGRAAYARRHRGTSAGQGIPLLPLPLSCLCVGCADCDPAMGMYGFYNGGDPRRFTPDEECSTEAERELHRKHCEAWEKGERPTVKVSGIEWTEAMTSTGRDGKPKTHPAGYKLVDRSAYGLGTMMLTDNQDGSYCGGKGYLPGRLTFRDEKARRIQHGSEVDVIRLVGRSTKHRKIAIALTMGFEYPQHRGKPTFQWVAESYKRELWKRYHIGTRLSQIKLRHVGKKTNSRIVTRKPKGNNIGLVALNKTL